ncbi:rhodanese-like domain-containing protein [Bacillaceae bacterium SIJ1]|uniref:rhodanese-like domain-containing protein n=1 Tax=Litoribacterium kuwaitense TaxID=1398745 RepID=UPI0013EA279D|nr:rhodanese-like domain-containing protein [Litoribacterium kuwaitense]NGP44221.1 rhodanese-like domain-containing protein [Litoribacterium kuwaitense]
MKEISTEELLNKIDELAHVIIDVREDEEVAEGMIPGAVHMRLATVPERLSELNKDKELIFVCRSGRRSEKAAEYAESHGYTCTNVVGGMLAWQGSTVNPE